ncbi:MAG: DUF1330 domain-containing protein [Hyphomicrobiaceae bacterium]
MVGYVLFDPGPRTDPEAIKLYSEKAFGTLVAFGGKLLARTNNVEVIEATNGPGWRPNRILLIEFPSIDATRNWYNSPEYQEILPLRLSSAQENVVMFEGVTKE